MCVCQDVLRDSGRAVLWPMIGEVGFWDVLGSCRVEYDRTAPSLPLFPSTSNFGRCIGLCFTGRLNYTFPEQLGLERPDPPVHPNR